LLLLLLLLRHMRSVHDHFVAIARAVSTAQSLGREE
jgi:hypothetical protein